MGLLTGVTHRLSRSQMVVAVVITVATIGLDGCTTANQTDIASLSSAVMQFRSAVAGNEPTTAARTDANKARVVQFIAGGTIPAFPACSAVTFAEKPFDADVAQANASAAASWQRLLKTAPCAWTPSLEPDPPAAPPSSSIINALNEYYAGVADIASATSVQQVVDATSKATAAASALVSLYPPAAVPAKAVSALIGKLVQYSLQTAQYEALKFVLGDIDPLLDQASVPIVNALRVQQGYWISQTSFFASDGFTALHDALANGSSPADRLVLYGAAQPILDDLVTQQQLVRTDPGAAYQALVVAHHKLYAALRANHDQLAAMFVAAQDIAGSAQSMAGAVIPNTKAAASAVKKDKAWEAKYLRLRGLMISPWLAWPQLIISLV